MKTCQITETQYVVSENHVETRVFPLMKNAMWDQVGLHALPQIIAIVAVQILVIVVTSLLLTASTIPAAPVAMIRLANAMAKHQI